MCVKNRYKMLLSYILAFSLFFAVPLFGDSVSARAEADLPVSLPEQVYVCGSPIGLRLNADGLMVTGYTAFLSEDEVYVNPAKNAGILIGDRILGMNGTRLQSAGDLSEALLRAAGQVCRAEICRNGEIMEMLLYPEREFETREYKIGVWVRECSAGIGTVTYYDAETGFFGALGHGINDSTTHALFPAGGGNAYPAVISGVRRGCSGTPGELRGYFYEDGGSIGAVVANSEIGVYGVLDKEGMAALKGTLMPVDRGGGIHEGEAGIVCTVDGGGCAEYRAVIERVDVREKGNKGICLRITDETLLAKTGGIVQGMSGSPIVQDGMLVGAVTHVLVNDSTRGYGIVIGNMLRYAAGCVRERAGGEPATAPPAFPGKRGCPYERGKSGGVLAA